MDDIFSPHKGGVQTPAMKPSWTLPTSITTINETALAASATLNNVSNNVDDIFSPHKGGVYTPARNLATFDGKSSLITIDGKALPTSVRVTTSLNGKSLNSNNLESMDKPKIWINPVLLIGGLLIVLLITKK